MISEIAKIRHAMECASGSSSYSSLANSIRQYTTPNVDSILNVRQLKLVGYDISMRDINVFYYSELPIYGNLHGVGLQYNLRVHCVTKLYFSKWPLSSPGNWKTTRRSQPIQRRLIRGKRWHNFTLAREGYFFRFLDISVCILDTKPYLNGRLTELLYSNLDC